MHRLPQPIPDGNDTAIACYDYAWRTAFGTLRKMDKKVRAKNKSPENPCKSGLSGRFVLFPLDGADRLGSEIKKHTVDAFYFGGDSVYDLMEHRVGDLLDGGGHGVLGVYGADDRGPTLISAVILYADRLDVGDNDEILPYLFCKTADIEFLAEDRVCFAECVQTVTGDRTEATNAKSGAGEGLTVDHSVGKTERFANYSYFVFEKKFNGLNEFKLKVIGKTAYVVVRLNSLFAFGLLNAF